MIANVCQITSTERSSSTYELSTVEFSELLNQSPIDRDQLLDNCMNNTEFALTLLEEFARTSHVRINTLEKGLAGRNHDELLDCAHSLKGVAGIIGTRSIVQACELLNSTKAESDWQQIGSIVQQLQQEILRTVDSIVAICSKR